MKTKISTLILIAIMTLAGSLQAAEWKYAMGEGESDPQGIYATTFKSYIPESSM